MRKLAILIFQTLDGVMQAPSAPEEDFSGDFTQGGWANECWAEVMEQVGREAMAEPYDLLLGKTTYESFASFFSNAGSDNPTAEKLNNAKKYVVTSSLKELQWKNPTAEKLNNAKKYVVTSSLKELQWKNSQKISGDIPAEISRLKEQDGPLLQVHGSWQLIQTLLTNELIDEFRLWTFPVVVGSGKRLFADGTIPIKMKLTKFETGPSGAFMNFWRQV